MITKKWEIRAGNTLIGVMKGSDSIMLLAFFVFVDVARASFPAGKTIVLKGSIFVSTSPCNSSPDGCSIIKF